MDDVVEVSIPVEAQAAAALADPIRREMIGRMISRMISRILRPHAGADPLLSIMDRMGAEAERRGLTPELLEQELAAHKAGRRD
jgi:hypothetical protein